MQLSREEFLDQLQKAYEHFAIKSLKEKRVPVTKENIKNEVKSLAVFSGAKALVGIRNL